MRNVASVLLVAVVAVTVSAIAVQSHVCVELYASEKDAAEALKGLAANNGVFKNSHSSNRYWVGDVYGLFDIKPRGGKDVGGMKIAAKSVCNADGAVLSRKINPLNKDDKKSKQVHFDTDMAPPDKPTSYSGYLFSVLTEYQEHVGGELMYIRYDTEGEKVTWLNPGRWGYIAYPQKYGTKGRLAFKIEAHASGRVYKRDPGDNIDFAKANTYSRWEQDPLCSGWNKDDGKYKPSVDAKFETVITVFVAKFESVKKNYGNTKFQKSMEELKEIFEKINKEFKKSELVHFTMLQNGVRYLKLCEKITKKEFSKCRDYYFRLATEFITLTEKLLQGDAKCGLKHKEAGTLECPFCDGQGKCNVEKCGEACNSCYGTGLCLSCFGEGTIDCPVCKLVK